MSSESFLVFDISGEYGHFRKFNTTTSPLTYGIPTPTAVIGVLGAVLGIERENDKGKVSSGQESLRESFSADRTGMAIRVLNPVNKVNVGFNLLATKSPQTFFNVVNRTQIEYELLKNPGYRIYLQWDHPRREELIDRLREKNFHFTPYLGTSQFTADVLWQGERESERIQRAGFVPFLSAVNLSRLREASNPIDINQINALSIQVETLPLSMQPNRIIERYGEVLVETTGQAVPALANDQSYTVEGEENIQLL